MSHHEDRHLIIRSAAGTPPSDEEMRRYSELIDALEGEMRTAGALVFSGRLDRPTPLPSSVRRTARAT